MTTKAWFWLFFVTLFSINSVVTAQDPQGTYDDLAQKVEKKIRDKNKVQIDDLKVLNNNGEIYLEGVANLYGSHYYAEVVARKVDGVKNVKNDIAVRTGDVSDLEIESEAIAKIKSHLKGTPFDLVSVQVRSGTVRLLGNVRDQTIVEDAMDSVVWIKGVRSVENFIEKASIASGDERLRQAIYRRLNREFPQYFTGRFPSVLIIVNSARVILVGSVESNPSREKIGSIVRSMPGVLSIDNQLQTN